MQSKMPSNVFWDWSPDIWGWMPDRQRWAPDHGLPREPAYMEVSTDPAPPREAYDFWRETVWYGFDGDQRTEKTPFHAQARVVLSDNEYFAHYVSDGISGSRTAKQIRSDGHDEIELGLVLSGERQHRIATGETSVTLPGQFYFYDAAKPSRVKRNTHEGVHLSLQRQSVESVLSGKMPSAVDIGRMFQASRLAPVLKDQMMIFARHMQRLTRSERGFLLDQTVRLALFALEELAPRRKFQEHETSRATLFTAAQRYIERHFTDFDLNAQRIAFALGTSRATLYRAFADQGMSVNDTIRLARLTHARQLLERVTTPISISDIAGRSGFADLRTFHRAFKDHFGISPGQVRQQRRQNNTLSLSPNE